MKHCNKCGTTKLTAEFYKKSCASDGLQSHCKVCINIANAAYLAKNPEKEKVRKAKYHAANQKKCNAASAKWHAQNKEIANERSAKWHATNPDRARQNNAIWYANNIDRAKKTSAKWAKENSEKRNSYYAKYYSANPEKFKIKKQNRRARKLAAGGKLSKDLSERLFKLQRGKCACCDLPLGENYHMDHIMPLALGGSNEDRNIQLLRQKCNKQKSAKHPIDFMQQRGFLL